MFKSFVVRSGVAVTLWAAAVAPVCAQEQVEIAVQGAKSHDRALRVKATASSTPVVITTTASGYATLVFTIDVTPPAVVAPAPALGTAVTATILASDNNRNIAVTAKVTKTVPVTASSIGPTAFEEEFVANAEPVFGDTIEAMAAPRDSVSESSLVRNSVFVDGQDNAVEIQLAADEELAVVNQPPAATVTMTASQTITLHVDSRPPTPLSPFVESFTGGSATLTIPFEENDLDLSTVSSGDFTIYQEHRDENNNNPTFSRVLPDTEHRLLRDNTQVLLNFKHLSPGVHYLVVHDIADLVGNGLAAAANPFSLPTTGIQTGTQFRFIVPGGVQHGEQVEYPRTLRPKNDLSEFDPGDRVDTRVVQLYYFRDARLVAEYINRNIKDLNQSGYDEAQRFAQQARDKAADTVDERRFKENLAVESAQRTREIENEIRQTREQLEQTLAAIDQLKVEEQQLNTAAAQYGTGVTPSTISAEIVKSQASLTSKQAQIAVSDRKVSTAEATLRAAQIAERDAVGVSEKATAKKNREDAETALEAAYDERDQLEEDKNQLQSQIAVQRTIQSRNTLNADQKGRAEAQRDILKGKLDAGQLPKQLQDQQVKEIDTRNSTMQAEASELRAAQEEFRREVAAGLADRNSYAKGKIESIDPVTQVTISVVGTSRLQLRGPIKGVNKICRMVHQLDSPVGQVKIGIHTIQVNGEHGDRMDFVYERINQEVAHSRFLVNTSSQLLRRAVQEVAAEVALEADQGYLPEGCPPELSVGVVNINGTIQTTAEQRDRRYVYAFFGSDFIGELEAMDSELLNTENKMLSLHSMDTVSLAGTLFVMAHADHPVRQRIVMRFQELLAGELPEREMEYVQALTHVTKHGKSLQNRFRTVMRIDNKHASEIYFNAHRTYRFPNTVSYFNEQVQGQGTLNPVQYSTIKMAQALKAQLVAEMELKNHVLERSLLETKEGETAETYRNSIKIAEDRSRKAAADADAISQAISQSLFATSHVLERFAKDPQLWQDVSSAQAALELAVVESKSPTVTAAIVAAAIGSQQDNASEFIQKVYAAVLDASGIDIENSSMFAMIVEKSLKNAENPQSSLAESFRVLRLRAMTLSEAIRAEGLAKKLKEDSEEVFFSQRLLDQFIDEQEEKSVELMEALRSHSSNVDNYLKRLAIAVEDDVAAQFYEPAFQRIRRVSRSWDVTLGQIETTTVLTNNRTLAKVSPAATFEFDLPQRDILLTEALNGSKALANEYGNLLKDGTFLAGTAMLSGQPPSGVIGDNAPIQGIPGMQQNQDFGSELQKLIPDPAIYKFETGTGFEIQPIIQPDGHSIVYGFDYMYSTNVREPVRADEKHLGRIKRHFVHTDVQTSSYELREISRYTVALKASRTDRGVPLFEDLPGIGAAFRPLPSEESSLQTNIILGSSTIYPTVFDLMGLRWSAYVDQLSSPGIAEEKVTQANRREELRSHLLDTTREKVNKRIRLQLPREPKVNHVTPGFLPQLENQH